MTPNKSWVEDFYEKFDDVHSEFYYDCDGHLDCGNISPENIKHFITELLSQEKSKMLNKIETDLIQDSSFNVPVNWIKRVILKYRQEILDRAKLKGIRLE